METGPVIIVAAVLIGMVVLLTILFNRRREHLWQIFARRHGLTFQKNGRPEVQGRVNGQRKFSLRESSRSSDTGVMGVEEITMSVSVQGVLPKDVEVTQGGWIKKAEEMLEEIHHVQTGDEDFDRQVGVRGRSPEQLRDFLTEDRKQALLELLSLGEGGKVGLRGNEIFLREREMLTSLDHLEDRFQTMLSLARRLDN